MKTISMEYSEYQTELSKAQNKGFNNCIHSVVEAFELLNKGKKKDAFELLTELTDYRYMEEIGKAIGYDFSQDFKDSDAPNYNEDDRHEDTSFNEGMPF